MAIFGFMGILTEIKMGGFFRKNLSKLKDLDIIKQLLSLCDGNIPICSSPSGNITCLGWRNSSYYSFTGAIIVYNPVFIKAISHVAIFGV